MPYKDKEKQKEFQRKWMADRRTTWIEKNGPCKQCTATKNLEVDHINPEMKLFNPRALWALKDDNPKKIEELKKCQVLCKNCHEEKTRNFYLPKRRHGTSVMYNKQHCRCFDCKNWNITRVRKQRRT